MIPKNCFFIVVMKKNKNKIDFLGLNLDMQTDGTQMFLEKNCFRYIHFGGLEIVDKV